VVADVGSCDGSSNGFYVCAGRGNFIQWTASTGTSDFAFNSEFKVDSIGTNTALAVVLWSGETPQHWINLDSHTQFMAEGGGWDVTSAGYSLTAATVHVIRLVRTRTTLAVLLDGVVVAGMESLPLSESITAVGWRPHRNTIRVQSMSLESNLPIFPVVLLSFYPTALQPTPFCPDVHACMVTVLICVTERVFSRCTGSQYVLRRLFFGLGLHQKS
jgi:hypothetical protein